MFGVVVFVTVANYARCLLPPAFRYGPAIGIGAAIGLVACAQGIPPLRFATLHFVRNDYYYWAMISLVALAKP